jgi:hypothetical protein
MRAREALIGALMLTACASTLPADRSAAPLDWMEGGWETDAGDDREV